jgi:hypothetical protein
VGKWIRGIAALALITTLVACDEGPPTTPTPTPTPPVPVPTATPPKPPEGPSESELAVVSFLVLEYQQGARWWYAPRLEVRETMGKSIAVVTKLGFSLSDAVPVGFYTTSKCVSPLEQRHLLIDLYGDHELEMAFDEVGNRTPSKIGTGVIAYEDSKGRPASLIVSGPIVAGAPPTTYTGGSPTWGCGGQ